MPSYSDCHYWDLPRAKELLPSVIVKAASKLFAHDTGLSGPQIFEFFSKFSDEVGGMRYGSGAPSRWQMFENFLESLPIDQQRQALLELCEDQSHQIVAPDGGSIRHFVSEFDETFADLRDKRAILLLHEWPGDPARLIFTKPQLELSQPFKPGAEAEQRTAQVLHADGVFAAVRSLAHAAKVVSETHKLPDAVELVKSEVT